MSSTNRTYTSSINANILPLACEDLANELGWEYRQLSAFNCKLKTPKDYANHTLTFQLTFIAIDPRQTQVQIAGNVSGLFSDKSVLEPEMEKLVAKIEKLGRALTDKALSEGYMCPTCGRLLDPGLVACPHDGTPLKKT